jgi:hypothetical protein
MTRIWKMKRSSVMMTLKRLRNSRVASPLIHHFELCSLPDPSQ